MSVQGNLLGQVSDVSSQGEDHFLDLSYQEGEPIEESGAILGGLRLPSAFGVETSIMERIPTHL